MRRLYNAVCGWLEASAEAMQGEPQREGDNFTTTDLGRPYSGDPEMHLGYRPQSIDDDNGATVRPISLKWRRADHTEPEVHIPSTITQSRAANL